MLSSLVDWQELCQNGSSHLEFTRVPFNHPLFILYTSGTTGLPKAVLIEVD
ncbi:AMP-binding protein [Bacillus sp. JJ1562]|uniref:AMP-binding protein n=1 Tax=Bacillus sp. JJ1562 TaxID=3122960 RepID=UPI003002636F